MPLPDASSLLRIAAGARAQAERFSLPWRDHAWSGQAGELAGASVGSSLDFQDHRSYVPGDDPRHINWQAYARTGQYSLKLYRQEVHPVVDVILDLSESMLAIEEKAQRTLELLYFVCASAARTAAATSLILVKGPHWKALSRGALENPGWTELARQMPPTESAAPPGLHALPLRARSLRVLLSDLLYVANPDPLLKGLLRGQGRPLVLAPSSRTESEPEWDGQCEFLDTENGELESHHVDAKFRLRYQEAYRAHFARWQMAARRGRVPLARVPADLPFAQALSLEALPAGAVALC